ncbi:uncharacterized protein LOC135499851 isoform X2 [Lineus longissimus]|uniref:uncharacterized protein LOC135499851 isoform X2 n=1 Tax=Lineus longissimus TaxID=88925 RepID=UPI00315DBBA4
MKLTLCLIFAGFYTLVAASADEETLGPFHFSEELDKRGDQEEFGGCNASGNKVKITKDNEVIEKACVGEWSEWTRCRPWRKVSKRATCKLQDKQTGKCKAVTEEERPCKH